MTPRHHLVGVISVVMVRNLTGRLELGKKKVWGYWETRDGLKASVELVVGPIAVCTGVADGINSSIHLHA